MRTKTIVTTDGRVLRQGTDGLIVANYDGVEIMDINEVSDDNIINLFISLKNGGELNTKDLNECASFEILASR